MQDLNQGQSILDIVRKNSFRGVCLLGTVFGFLFGMLGLENAASFFAFQEQIALSPEDDADDELEF